MSAVLPFLETEEFHFPENAGQGLNGLSALAASKTADELIGKSNLELTRLLWARTLIQQELAKRTFRLVIDTSKSPSLVVRLSEPMPVDTVPWFRLSSEMQNINVFSTNSKMRCPTFDLPAGASSVGGTCPAAGPAQTTSIGRGDNAEKSMLEQRPDGRYFLKLYPSVEFNLARTVCAECYATGGTYGNTSTQVTELVHEALVKSAMQNSQMRAALLDAFVWQIPLLPFDRWQEGEGELDEEGNIVAKKAGHTPPDKVRERMARYPKVFRVHSSGDFFTAKYAKFWIDVARRVQAQHGEEILFWAPTRTQFLPNWAEFWKTANVPSNFIIRPSGYHVGDAAPMAQGIAAGTSVLTPKDAEVSRGEKYDHQCGVYDLKQGNKTCVEALDPDGNPGCRACWMKPNRRINYVAH
jgi:hypothetical protein